MSFTRQICELGGLVANPSRNCAHWDLLWQVSGYQQWEREGDGRKGAVIVMSGRVQSQTYGSPGHKGSRTAGIALREDHACK